MNILQINTNDIKGGAAQIFWSIKSGMESHGHKVYCLVANKESEDKNTNVIKQNRWKKLLAFIFSNDIIFYNSDALLNSEEFKNCDIVHCHNLSGHFFGLRT